MDLESKAELIRMERKTRNLESIFWTLLGFTLGMEFTIIMTAVTHIL